MSISKASVKIRSQPRKWHDSKHGEQVQRHGQQDIVKVTIETKNKQIRHLKKWKQLYIYTLYTFSLSFSKSLMYAVFILDKESRVPKVT